MYLPLKKQRAYLAFPLRGSCHEVTDEVFYCYTNLQYFIHLIHRLRGPPSPQGEGFFFTLLLSYSL